MIAFNIGTGQNDAHPKRFIEGTFGDLAREALATKYAETKDGPWIGGPFVNGHRSGANAMPRAWVALDLDKIGDEVQMLAIVEAAEAWQGFAYTTFSHKPEAGVFKLRMVFATDREVTPGEYPMLCSGLAKALARFAGFPVDRDTACDKIEQLLFTARAGATTWSFDGVPIVVDELLDHEYTAGSNDANGEGAAHGTYEDWLAMLLDARTDVHPAALRVVGRMVAVGLNDAAIRAWFAGIAQRVADVRGAERAAALVGDELDRMISGARRKGYAPPPTPEIDPPDDDDGDAPAAPHPGRVSNAPMESDIWLSALFAKRFTGQFRWSPGLDWMHNLGTHWERDERAVRLTRAKAMCAEISRSGKIAKDTRRSIASAKTVGAVLTLARAEPEINTAADAWDRDPMVLNTPAGPIDLQTGKPPVVVTEFLDLFTQITTVAPDPTMRTPNWLRFVTEIFACDLEMVEFIQRLAGYCLTGDRREQRLPFFYGTGANGKSVLVDELLGIMGSYALNLPSEALMRQQHQAHPTELAQLRGKRLAVSSELEDGAYWAEARIKALTGDATLTARFMRQDHFTFRQTQKHVVVGNFKPRLKGDDPAIARRMLLVPFTEKFTGSRCDPLLSKKLATERPGILAWMIEGAVKWARDGLLIPARVRDASAEYLNANDDISLWIEDCCATGPMLRATTSALYKSFSEWKEANGERPQSVNPWSARMAQRFNQYRTKHGRGFDGVALRDLSEPAYSYAQARA